MANTVFSLETLFSYPDSWALYHLHLRARHASAENERFLLPRPLKAFEDAVKARHVIAAYQTSEPCGFVMLIPEDRKNTLGRAQICALTLEPAYEGNGLGTKLVNAASELATDRGYKEVFARVAQDNKPARATFEKCGFTLAQETTRADGTPIHVLVRTLGI